MRITKCTITVHWHYYKNNVSSFTKIEKGLCNILRVCLYNSSKQFKSIFHIKTEYFSYKIDSVCSFQVAYNWHTVYPKESKLHPILVQCM